ncbi:hypothetical protein ACT453_49185, partial [Bacillus sp. D-CC]
NVFISGNCASNLNTLMDKALDDATRAEDVVKVAQKELPVVESVINDGQDTLKSLDAFFARNDETLQRAPFKPVCIAIKLFLIVPGARCNV